MLLTCYRLQGVLELIHCHCTEGFNLGDTGARLALNCHGEGVGRYLGQLDSSNLQHRAANSAGKRSKGGQLRAPAQALGGTVPANVPVQAVSQDVELVGTQAVPRAKQQLLLLIKLVQPWAFDI